MSKTYSCITGPGRIVRDPYYLLSLELDGKVSDGNGEFPMGAFSVCGNVPEFIGYLAMRAFDVTLSQQAAWMEECKPILRVTDVEKDTVHRFDHTGKKLAV